MDIIERLKIAEETKKDVMGVGDFMKGTSVIQEAIYEITSLRQQLTEQTSDHIVDVNKMVGGSVEVLLEALRKIASFTQDTDLLWWQKEARDALNAYSSKPTVK
jgi:hypothetical protein